MVNAIPEVNKTQSYIFESFPKTSSQRYLLNEVQNDSFARSADKSNNGKFDISECAKNFIKGVISPVTAVIEHPVMTVGIIAASAAACTLVPVLGPAMGIGFAALSVFQLGKGVFDVVKNYKNGEYDKAEKCFNQVGQGTVGVATSVLGIKQSAKIAKEAKLMKELNVTSLTQAQKEAIALEVKKGSTIDAIKEAGSLFTTKEGIQAAASQFKPSNMLQRGKDAVKHVFTKQEVTKVKKETAKFTETKEGQRRANLSSEEIEAEVKALYKQACDEYGIPEELRPEIEITKNTDIMQGGGYNSTKHKIIINENSYRNGVFDLPDVIKHESTHANQAILRQRLPLEEKEQLAKDYLLDKIMNGDKENVITGEGNCISGLDTIKPPKMNAQMKKDFAALAESKLYQKGVSYTPEELTAMVKPLVESNLEFVQGYESADDAVNALSKYALAHNNRYKIAVNQSSGFNTENIDISYLKELTPEEHEAAVKSVLDGIDCLESNGANSGGIFNFGGDFNQYQFTPEEVLAQKQGNSFELRKLKAQLADLRNSSDYDMAEEARLLDKIKQHELIIEYKTKGQEMYRLYTESVNHPENTELAAKVSKMEAQLDSIQSDINGISAPTSNNILGLNPYVETNEYSTYQVMERPQTGASTQIPYSTPQTAAIIADNIDEQE